MVWLDFAVLTFIYYFCLFRKRKKASKEIFVVKTLMYIYLSFVLYLTLMPVIANMPFIFGHSYKPMNLHPFEDIIHGYGDAEKQVVLNVLMTIPFGILCPMHYKRKRFIFIKTFFATFFLSLFIELVQPLISTRTSDITDVITNTAGGVIGLLIYYCLKLLITKISKKQQ